MNAHQTEVKYVTAITPKSAHLCSEVINYLKNITRVELTNLRTETSESLTDVIILTNSNVLFGTNIRIYTYIQISGH